MDQEEMIGHLNALMNTLNVAGYLIPVSDVKTIDFSDPSKVVVETFDGFVATETDEWGILNLKDQFNWRGDDTAEFS